jgi:DNA-binding transcriptional ArsR family regulator
MRVRPLFHPSLEVITVEGILHGLSDPVRVAIFADIVAQECSHNCSMFLSVSDKAIPKSTLSQHFRALREAELIRGERRGVEMYNTSRCAEIENASQGYSGQSSTHIPSNPRMKLKQKTCWEKIVQAVSEE